MRYFSLIIFSLVIMTSCNNDDIEGLTVGEYISINNLETIEIENGIHIIIHQQGNNNRPNINSRIRVEYTGMLTSGSVFDSNQDIEFDLFNLIRGWQIGMKEIGVGGSATIIIPSEQGFGDAARVGIPANSTVIFDVRLIDIII